MTLGGSHDRVVTIDDDLGKSGQSIEGRPGFQRLLAEVALDHVGRILGLEMSRLARCGKDGHHLLELCGRNRVRLADTEGIYDPTEYSDRLLLGLHGVLNEAELHVLKQRMYQGKLNKARRGELLGTPPIGYLRLVTGAWAIDPDEQVQTVVRLLFDPFDREATLHGLLRYLVHHQIRIPVRVAAGPNKGQLHTITRPVARSRQQSDYQRLVVWLRELCSGRRNSAEIAQQRNAEGFRPPKRAKQFSREMVRRLTVHLGLLRRQRHGSRTGLGPDEYRPMGRPGVWASAGTGYGGGCVRDG